MSVSIPVGADPTPVLAAFRQIQDAVRRTTADAKSLSEVDLSHPELKALADDLRKADQNLRDLERLGRGGTAATVRKINTERFGTSSSPSGILGLLDYVGQTDRFFPDARDRARHIDAVGRYVLQGTSLAPRPPPPPEPPAEPLEPKEPPRPPGGGGGEGGAGGSGAGSIVGGALDFAKMATPWLLAAAGLHGLSSAVFTSLGQAEQESTSNDSLYRSTRDIGVSFDEMREKVRKASDGLEINYNQAQQLTQQWEHLTDATAGRAVAGMHLAASVAQGYGMDPGSWTQSLGTASYLGQDPRRFAMLIGDAVRQGQMHGQVDQVMQALLTWTERASRLAPGAGADDTQRFAQMYASMNASGVPGLKGMDGASLITQIDSTIRGGGAAGEASQAFMYKAFQRNGVTDPYAVRMLMQSGIFATPRSALGHGSNKTVYEMLRTELDREYGSSDSLRKDDAFANLTGLSMPQSRAQLSVPLGQFASTSSYLKAHGINLSSINQTGFPEIAQMIGPNADLNGERKRLLALSGSDRLSDQQRSSLQGKSGEDLRLALVQVLAQHGMTTTEGSDFKTSTDKLYNALTASGTGLIPAVTDLKDATGSLVGAVSDLTQLLGTAYKAMFHGNVPDFPPKQAANNMDTARQYLLGHGWSAGQTAGVLANAEAESGFDPGSVGDHGTSVGLFQWHNDRATEFENWAKANKLDPKALATQLAFLQYDLTQGSHKAVGDALRQTDGATQAGMLFTRLYEKPKGGDAEVYRRGQMAPMFLGAPEPLLPPALPKQGGPSGTRTLAPAMSSGPHSRQVSMDMTHRFAPLQIDVNVPGGQSHRQYLPVTSVGQPMPIGLA